MQFSIYRDKSGIKRLNPIYHMKYNNKILISAKRKICSKTLY